MLIGALLMTPLIAGVITLTIETKNDKEFVMAFMMNEMFLLFLIGFYKVMFSFLDF